MAVKHPRTPMEAIIPESVPKIFEQAQVSTANHQKNFVALYKLHSEAATFTDLVQDGRSLKLVGEKLFEDVFIGLVARALPVKKGATVVDRIVRFIAGYAKFIKDKVQATGKNNGDEGSDSDDEGDNTSSRFIDRLLHFLLKGFEAKDKVVRFRSVQTIAAILPHIGELDSRIGNQLRNALLERVHDKETPVRVQAVIALSKIIPSEEAEDVQEDALESLLEVLTHDLSSEVRRTALLNTPVTTATLPTLLSRTRDFDPTIRKLVFTSVLEQLESPKQLTIEQRELIVRNGLGDREASVRSAAEKLISDWHDSLEDSVSFLSLFDLYENKEAEQALLCVFKSRADVLDSLDFGEKFWDQLTPDKAFLARVFVEHCIEIKDEARLESTMPVMTALAFRIQSLYNELLKGLQANEEENLFNGEDVETKEKREAELSDLVFVLGEVLKLAVKLDYGDEIGRRKMFQLVKDMISQDTLPEPLVAHCLDIVRKLSVSERDLIRIVVEVIHELRDRDIENDIEGNTSRRGSTTDGELGPEDTPATVQAKTPGRPPKSLEEMTPEEKERADAMDLRCLSLCIGMLERVNSTFEENSTLEGILGELIIPAVKRKELALREKGLVSLGLCCLIARRMALNSFRLFLSQINGAPEQLKVRILHIVFDIMMVHEEELLGNAAVGGDRVVEFLTKLLENESSPEVQAVLVTGLAKLALSGMVTDDNVIKALIIAYVKPQTSGNQELRQCLSYFFPVFCLTSPSNQRRMQTIFMEVYGTIYEMYSELEEDEEMVHPLQIASLLVDWMDPQKAIEIRGQNADMNIHVDLSVDIIKALFDKDMDKESRKVLCQLLGKLYFPDDIDDDKIRTIKLLVNNVRSRRPLRDATSSTAFNKFDSMLSKKYEAKLEGFSEEEFRKLEELKDLFEFLDEIIPDDDVDEVLEARRGGRKRRSESVVTTTTTMSGADEDEYEGTPEPVRRKGSGKGPAKKRRVSKSSGEDESEADDSVTPPPIAPTRTMPRRAAKNNTAPIVLEIPDSEEDDFYSNSKRKGSKPKMRRRRATEESALDAEISELLEPEPADSIIDSASDRDEQDESSADEVDELL